MWFTNSVLRFLCVLVILGNARQILALSVSDVETNANTIPEYFRHFSNLRVRRDEYPSRNSDDEEKEEDKEYFCDDGNQKPLRCWCTAITAECKGDNNLAIHVFKYIPQLPRSITKLDFSSNRIAVVRQTFFANVSQLVHLDLSYNDIQSISAGVFDLMLNLTSLVLNHNPLRSLTSLRNTLATSSLLFVDAKYCEFPSFGNQAFENVNVSHIQILRLDLNSMEDVLSLSPVCRFKQLKVLSFYSNRITTLKLGCVLSSLEDLDLDFNHLVDFIPSCSPDGTSLFPQLEKLYLQNNNIRQVGHGVQICLPKLTNLNLEGNPLGYEHNGAVFDADRFPALQHLVLTRASMLNFRGLHKSLFDHSPIEYLELKDNFLNFDLEVQVHDDTFSSCRNIHELYLDRNVFSLVSDQKFQTLFGHLPLVVLSLEQTEFSAVSPQTFFNLTLLKELRLGNNKIVYIPDGTFDHLVNLRRLVLTQNQIQVIGRHTFGVALRGKLVSLMLNVNPFLCTCDLLWFRSWLRSDHGLFKTWFGKYRCSNRPDKVVYFVLPQQACLMSHEVSGYIIAFCTTFTLALTSALLLISYRWHLRLLLYEAFRGRDDGVRRQRLLQNNFTYDVFVSYASEDLLWVRNHLMPDLEGGLGLRLCVHERDFTLGHNIVDNIADCVESSKKVMIVFSKHFKRSQWCQFELTYCLRHVMDYDDVLIIVCVDDVASREMTTAMMAVLKTTTYIQWAELNDAVRSFWGRVHIALQEILDGEQRV